MGDIGRYKFPKKNIIKDYKNPGESAPVRGKDFNNLINNIQDGTSTDIAVDTLSVDTINETTFR
jgi:hypothetical protein